MKKKKKKMIIFLKKRIICYKTLERDKSRRHHKNKPG